MCDSDPDSLEDFFDLEMADPDEREGDEKSATKEVFRFGFSIDF